MLVASAHITPALKPLSSRPEPAFCVEQHKHRCADLRSKPVVATRYSVRALWRARAGTEGTVSADGRALGVDSMVPPRRHRRLAPCAAAERRACGVQSGAVDQ